MNRGGIESYMMNYYRHFDRNRVQVDFVVHNAGGFGYYDEKIKAMSGRIYVLPQKSKHPLTYISKLKQVIRSGDYKIVHTHMDAMGAWVLKAAKECGVPVRIAHSHNTQHLTTNPLKLYFLEKARQNIYRYATHRMACSEAAGKWLFGNDSFQVVRNAIDVDKFKFDPDMRKQIRKEYGIGDDVFLIGHVGRFDTQKNHTFLIDVFAQVVKQYPNCKLMLIGEGVLQELIIGKVKNMGLNDFVVMTGVRDDANKFYNAFDLFVLPSLFEGLGVVGIEAEMNGCDCLFSDVITREVDISGASRFVPLNKKEWAGRIVDFIGNHKERGEATFDLAASGYEIGREAQTLQQLYIDLWNKN